MKSDKHRKEFIEFDIEIYNELMEKSKRLLGRKKTVDCKSGIIESIMQKIKL